MKNLLRWWQLIVFLTTAADPSHSLRMMFNVLCHYDALPYPVIQNGGKNALWERQKTEQWHRVKNLLLWWQLIVFLTTVTDSSLALRMTFNVLCHYDALPYPVIQNGGKNTLWERRKTEQWHGVKNLLPWWESTNFLTMSVNNLLSEWHEKTWK